MKTMKFQILSILVIFAVSVGLNAADVKAVKPKAATNKKVIATKPKAPKVLEAKPEVKEVQATEAPTNEKPDAEVKSVETKEAATVPAASNSVLEFYNEITKRCSEGRSSFNEDLVKLDDRIRDQAKFLDRSKTETMFKEENLSSEIFTYFATDLISDDSDLRGFKACGDHYANFVKAVKEKEMDKANEQFGFWESCLQSDYKDSVPDIAQKIITCKNKARTPNQIKK